MYLTIILTFDCFLFWSLTNYLLSWTLLPSFNGLLPGGVLVLIVALYFIAVRPKPRVWFRTLSLWEWFRPRTITRGKAHHAEQVIYAVCPHGVYGEASTSFFVLNPDYLHVTPIASSVLFYIPLVRELAYLAGAVPANSSNISKLLDEEQSILILPEGLRGHLYDEDLAVLKGKTNGESLPRKGFIRLALTARTSPSLKIVPVWIAGTKGLYSTYHPVLWLQKLLLKNYYYCWPMLHWPIFPRRDVSIEVRFGEPISLHKKTVDQVYDEYVTEMERLIKD